MNNDRRWRMVRAALTLSALLLLSLCPGSAPLLPWQVYAFHDGSLSPLPVSFFPRPRVPASPCSHVAPDAWRISASTLTDVTGDDAPECVLLVWRPWRDWPIQRWLPVPSPIAGLHDAGGDSCHLILLDPDDGREMWAGSALPAPFVDLIVGDVDGDGRAEVVTLEGDYAAGRDGPATHVDVWRWNGFGFTLEHRSPPGVFRESGLTDVDNDGILDIVVR
jgi:hypothetical protein